VRWALVVFWFSFSLIGTCVWSSLYYFKPKSVEAVEMLKKEVQMDLVGDPYKVKFERGWRVPIKCNSHEDQTLSMCVILTHVMFCFCACDILIHLIEGPYFQNTFIGLD